MNDYSKLNLKDVEFEGLYADVHYGVTAAIDNGLLPKVNLEIFIRFITASLKKRYNLSDIPDNLTILEDLSGFMFESNFINMEMSLDDLNPDNFYITMLKGPTVQSILTLDDIKLAIAG